jgi:hypothetical protein
MKLKYLELEVRGRIKRGQLMDRSSEPASRRASQPAHLGDAHHIHLHSHIHEERGVSDCAPSSLMSGRAKGEEA